MINCCSSISVKSFSFSFLLTKQPNFNISSPLQKPFAKLRLCSLHSFSLGLQISLISLSINGKLLTLMDQSCENGRKSYSHSCVSSLARNTYTSADSNTTQIFVQWSVGWIKSGSAKVRWGGIKQVEESRIIYKPKAATKPPKSSHPSAKTYSKPLCRDARKLKQFCWAWETLCLLNMPPTGQKHSPHTSKRSRIQCATISKEGLIQEQGSALERDECPCSGGLKSTCEESTLWA